MKVHRIFLPLLIIFSCATLKDAPLKDLPADREYVISVQRVIDSRLPSLTEAQFQDMLDRLQGYIREYLGYRVSFYLMGNQDLLMFSKSMDFSESAETMKALKNDLLDMDSPADHQRLRDYIFKLVSRTETKVLRRYVKDYDTFESREKLADHLYRQYVVKLKRIQNITTADGTPLNAPAYAETLTYPFWDMALMHLKNAHFIFTNTVMADMEVNIPIYVVLRYGVTTGMVEKNLYNSYRAAGILFTYPFLSADGFFVSERGEAIPPEELTDVIALYATHEFGHFLNHYKDYYDHDNCIMVAAMDLNYYQWYRLRKEKKCDLKHEKLKQF